MAVSSTSPQRTYRYLRIAIAGTVVAIFVAVAAAIPVVGVLPSISHYFYSPAHGIFVGALTAAAICLFALSGRGAERALLDAAGLFALLIAIVPTPIAPRDEWQASALPEGAASCAGMCVPPAYAAGVDNGVMTYLVVGALVIVLGILLVSLGAVAREGAVLSLGIAAAVLVVVGLTWWLARPALLQYGHFIAAAVFFSLVAAVALTNAFWPAGPHPVSKRLRRTYVALALALVIDMVAMGVLSRVRGEPFRPILVGEVIALSLFVAYWVLQSVQKWTDTNPTLAAASGAG